MQDTSSDWSQTTTEMSLLKLGRVDKIQLLKSKLRSAYKMFRDNSHNRSYRSQQSSDIALSQVSHFEQSFRPSVEQIQNVQLYNDLPSKLLREPDYQTQQQAAHEQKLFENSNEYFIFDSIVFNAKMMDDLIHQERLNKTLRAQIDKLDEYQKQNENLLKVLKNKRVGKKNSINTSQKIFKNMDQETERLSDHIKPQAWFEDFKKLQATRLQTIKLAKEEWSEQKKSLQNRVDSLKNKKQKLREQNARLEQDLQKVQIQLQKQKLQNRKQNGAIYIEKQLKQILKLKEVISKMEETIKKNRE